MRVKKAQFNAVVNVVMFSILLIASVSGILLGIARSGDGETSDLTQAPAPPSRTGGALNLWIHLHIATCSVLLALIATHLLLHIPYIKKLPRLLSRRSSRARREGCRREGEAEWQRSRT